MTTARMATFLFHPCSGRTFRSGVDKLSVKSQTINILGFVGHTCLNYSTPLLGGVKADAKIANQMDGTRLLQNSITKAVVDLINYVDSRVSTPAFESEMYSF